MSIRPAVDEVAHRIVEGRRHDPVDVPTRVHPDVRHHAGDIVVLRGADESDHHPTALQVPDRSHGLVGEQLVAPGVEAGERDHGLPGVDSRDEARRSVRRDVRPIRDQQVSRPHGRAVLVDIFDLGEALQP
jgi:hypothetical protein